jgi:hypothetical protein
MFTDGPATPVRLEVLLDVIKSKADGIKREVLYELLQPSSLSGRGQDTTKNTLSAAKELGLVEEKTANTIKLGEGFDRKKSAQENILNAIDQKVLTNAKIELHLALFFAYCLGLDTALYEGVSWSNDEWADKFNEDVFQNELGKNPFNATKYTGLNRWLSYIGLGWYDSNGQFQPDPAERLLRALPAIFGSKKKLPGDDFMEKLAEACPELDGGKLFLQANKYRVYDPTQKQCSLGLSQALLGLHEDGRIRLTCTNDSRSWIIGIAEPTYDDWIKSDRITHISLP